MSHVLLTLQQHGQILSRDLADYCGITERAVHVALYPHVAAGAVMACDVLDGSGKRLGTEYRLSGTVPRSRPGPKVGAAAGARA